MGMLSVIEEEVFIAPTHSPVLNIKDHIVLISMFNPVLDLLWEHTNLILSTEIRQFTQSC